MADYHIPDDCSYTKEDEWVREDGDVVLIGVTDYAQRQLGDVVFLEMPAAGTEINAGEPFGVIESVKAVSELYAPLTAVVIEPNAALEETPELVNESCYDDGWILKLTPSDDTELEGLLSPEAYRAFIAEREE